MERFTRRKFVATAAIAGAVSALRAPAFVFEKPRSLVEFGVEGNRVGREVVLPHATPFPMKNVRLRPGAFSLAAEANLKYLKTLPTDRLLHTFRLTAGLPSSGRHWVNGKNRTA